MSLVVYSCIPLYVNISSSFYDDPLDINRNRSIIDATGRYKEIQESDPTMTTETLRRDTKSMDAERRTTAAADRAGRVERGELPSYQAAVLERMGELVIAGYYREARAMHLREFAGE